MIEAYERQVVMIDSFYKVHPFVNINFAELEAKVLAHVSNNVSSSIGITGRRRELQKSIDFLHLYGFRIGRQKL